MGETVEAIKPGDLVKHKDENYLVIREPYHGFLVGFIKRSESDVKVWAFRPADCSIVRRGAESEVDCRRMWTGLSEEVKEALRVVIRKEAKAF